MQKWFVARKEGSMHFYVLKTFHLQNLLKNVHVLFPS